MVTVSYYRVSVPLPTDATLDLDTIMGRVEYYNSSRRLLIFDTYSEDKHLQFIFYFRKERAEDNFVDELMEISNMFESDVKMTPLKPSELSIQQLQKIRMAKRIIEPWLSCSSNPIPRWCLHTKDEVLSLLSEIIGFTEFKEFVGSLEVYLNNTHSIGNRVYLNKKLLHDIVKYTKYSVLFKYTTTAYSIALNIVSFLQATFSRFKRQISDKF